MNEVEPTAQSDPQPNVQEDPKSKKRQRMQDAFLIGSAQSSAMNVDFFNRNRK